MAAVVERHPHDRVAGIEHRHVGGVVGLGAGVGLDVRVLGAEQLLGPIDRQLLGDVDLLAAAVIAASGIALGVLVGEHRAGRVEHRLGDEVLRGDHLQRALLALELAPEHLGDLRVDLGQRRGLEVLRKLVRHRGDHSIGPRPRLRAQSRASRRLSSAAVKPALAQDQRLAARLDRGDVDDRRRQPGELAAVERQVGRGDDLGVDRRRSSPVPVRPSGSPRSGRSRTQLPPAGHRSAAGRAARGRGRRRADSGARGWRPPGSPGPGAGRRAHRACAGRAPRPARASPAARSTSPPRACRHRGP